LLLHPGHGSRRCRRPNHAREAAEELLYPYTYDHNDPTKVYAFDYTYSPEGTADLTDGITDHMWPVSERIEPKSLAGMEIEAAVTPDRTCHEPDDTAQLWDEARWLNKALRVFGQHRECLALRHVLHV
jgi:hypothetical protein